MLSIEISTRVFFFPPGDTSEKFSLLLMWVLGPIWKSSWIPLFKLLYIIVVLFQICKLVDSVLKNLSAWNCYSCVVALRTSQKLLDTSNIYSLYFSTWVLGDQNLAVSRQAQINSLESFTPIHLPSSAPACPILMSLSSDETKDLSAQCSVWLALMSFFLP